MSLNIHKKVRILLAGGGTGGHIFPGIALVEEFNKRKDREIECLMVISSKPLDESILKRERIEYRKLPVGGVNWGVSVRAITDIYKIFLSFLKAWEVISDFRPDLIIGLGAYISLPVVVVGRIRNITTYIQEQNVIPGSVNRIMGRWVNKIFISFPQTKGFFPPKKVLMAGNPIRPLPFPLKRDKRLLRAEWGLEPDLTTILVCGGSRGAHSINIKATGAFKTMRDRGVAFQVIHSSGREDYESVLGFYEAEGIKCLVKPFFEEMMQIYTLADLVISRAGAGFIAEITAVGKPAILIPYPYSKAQHQGRNAEAMVCSGGAKMIDDSECTGDYLADVMIELFENPGLLNALGKASSNMGRPKAAEVICDHVLSLLDGKRKVWEASKINAS